ncbi:MAG: TIGR02266 family protein [Deltaproteobacteria bacterium]|nr:MAG: TIGR02266 family protein [Deltaproteobacteria bacterium]
MPGDDRTIERERDRRRFKRTDILLKVKYAAASDFIADYTENVSKGGLFIATDENFEIDDTFDFEVSFPGLLNPIPLTGRVKWVRRKGGDQPAGIGVEIVSEPGEHRPLEVLVDRMNGSTKGSGSEDEPGSDQERHDRAVQLPVVPVEGTFRVLLVEDNLVVRDMFRYGIQKLLRERQGNTDFVVREADNGQDAWKLLQKEAFNLIVLDLYMPVMDGNQLIEKVRSTSETRDIPIIVVSSGGEEDRKKAMAAGADMYLSKPIKLKQLVETIGRLIGT